MVLQNLAESFRLLLLFTRFLSQIRHKFIVTYQSPNQLGGQHEAIFMDKDSQLGQA